MSSPAMSPSGSCLEHDALPRDVRLDCHDTPRLVAIGTLHGMSTIGQSIPRLDGSQKVSGMTRYAGDVQLPGMLHARLVVSPHANARIVKIDGSAAEALPGVIGVFTAAKLPIKSKPGGDRNRAPLAVDRVVFNGHPIAAVVAETEAIAEDAAQLVQVEYDEL